MITHGLTSAYQADRIIVMDQGSIVEVGRHDQLLQEEGVYFSLAMA